MFERAGVADWNDSLTENGLDSLKLTQLIKVHALPPATLSFLVAEPLPYTLNPNP